MQVNVQLTELNAQSVIKASTTQAACSVISTSFVQLTISTSASS